MFSHGPSGKCKNQPRLGKTLQIFLVSWFFWDVPAFLLETGVCFRCPHLKLQVLRCVQRVECFLQPALFLSCAFQLLQVSWASGPHFSVANIAYNGYVLEQEMIHFSWGNGKP